MPPRGVAHRLRLRIVPAVDLLLVVVRAGARLRRSRSVPVEGAGAAGRGRTVVRWAAVVHASGRLRAGSAVVLVVRAEGVRREALLGEWMLELGAEFAFELNVAGVDEGLGRVQGLVVALVLEFDLFATGN